MDLVCSLWDKQSLLKLGNCNHNLALHCHICYPEVSVVDWNEILGYPGKIIIFIVKFNFHLFNISKIIYIWDKTISPMVYSF